MEQLALHKQFINILLSYSYERNEQETTEKKSKINAFDNAGVQQRLSFYARSANLHKLNE